MSDKKTKEVKPVESLEAATTDGKRWQWVCEQKSPKAYVKYLKKTVEDCYRSFQRKGCFYQFRSISMTTGKLKRLLATQCYETVERSVLYDNWPLRLYKAPKTLEKLAESFMDDFEPDFADKYIKLLQRTMDPVKFKVLVDQIELLADGSKIPFEINDKPVKQVHIAVDTRFRRVINDINNTYILGDITKYTETIKSVVEDAYNYYREHGNITEHFKFFLKADKLELTLVNDNFDLFKHIKSVETKAKRPFGKYTNVSTYSYLTPEQYIQTVKIISPTEKQMTKQYNYMYQNGMNEHLELLAEGGFDTWVDLIENPLFGNNSDYSITTLELYAKYNKNITKNELQYIAEMKETVQTESYNRMVGANKWATVSSSTNKDDDDDDDDHVDFSENEEGDDIED